jgi:peptide/nickel transport system substrate-binding protein
VSPFVLESLEALIQKPGGEGIGTGPYVPVGKPTPGLRAFRDHYLGRPVIEQITETPYPSVRTAWAELLRDNLDMLYEVNVDALDSLQAASGVAVFSFVRHYQYALLFGAHSSSLNSAAIRRELNATIDRSAVVRDALAGHGIPSTGPVPPDHWALESAAPHFGFDAMLAKSLTARHLKFTVLTPADSVYERMALVIKQQLAAASVEMYIQEATQDEIFKALGNDTFDAVLVDMISGPSLFRLYKTYSSKVPSTQKLRGGPQIDAALEQIRHAPSDDAYRAGVTAFQQAIVDDPPALFLAWSERARAVSRRFDVAAPDKGREVLSTLQFWRPSVSSVARR